MSPSSPARIRVEQADAVDRSCDVLVLKYAQQPHGLDRSVLGRLGLAAPAKLPAVGEAIVLRRPPGIGARALVLIGTAEIVDFGYRDIREFGRRAVEVVATELPEARELCLTLHGAGFGLDEREAFRAQVAGLLEGRTASPAVGRLRTITFLERGERRAARMSAELAQLVTQRHVATGGADFTSFEVRPRAREWLSSAGIDSDARPHAFVAMPFDDAFTDLFRYGIVASVERVGLLCERMDRSVFTGDVVEHMQRRIRSASVVVADLSGANPNVYLEIGFAWACGVPTVLLCNDDTEPHFDVRGYRHLRYRSIRDAEQHLDRELSGFAAREWQVQP